MTSLSRCAIRRVGEVAQLAQRDGVGRQRQGDDRRVGRVHLGIGRRIGQVARQRRAGGVDGGLHVLRGGVDVAVEVELQRDLADAVRTLDDVMAAAARDLRRTGVRAAPSRAPPMVSGLAPGKLGGHLDGGEVDLRQRGRPAAASSPARRPAARRRRAATWRSAAG